MKIWIEKDVNGFVYVHPTEPHPNQESDSDKKKDRYWETKEGDVGIEVIDEQLSSFLSRGMKKDTVAEFKMNCIWERA